jgi:hypothetical protein
VSGTDRARCLISGCDVNELIRGRISARVSAPSSRVRTRGVCAAASVAGVATAAIIIAGPSARRRSAPARVHAASSTSAGAARRRAAARGSRTNGAGTVHSAGAGPTGATRVASVARVRFAASRDRQNNEPRTTDHRPMKHSTMLQAVAAPAKSAPGRRRGSHQIQGQRRLCSKMARTLLTVSACAAVLSGR